MIVCPGIFHWCSAVWCNHYNKMITKFLPYKGHYCCCQGQYDHNCCLRYFTCRHLEHCQFLNSNLKSNTFHLSVFAPFFTRLCKHPLVSLRITRSRFQSAKVTSSVLVDLFTWTHPGKIAPYSRYQRANHFKSK